MWTGRSEGDTSVHKGYLRGIVIAQGPKGTPGYIEELWNDELMFWGGQWFFLERSEHVFLDLEKTHEEKIQLM